MGSQALPSATPLTGHPGQPPAPTTTPKTTTRTTTTPTRTPRSTPTTPTHPCRQVPGRQPPAHRLPLILQQRRGCLQPLALPPPVVAPAEAKGQPQQHPAAAQPQVPGQVDGTEPEQRPAGGRQQRPRRGGGG